MALNEMIAQGAQFKMPDPLEQYGRIAQIQQAQNQNALAQYQISSAQRADETNTNFLGALRAAGNDPMKIQQAYINAGKGKEASEYATSLLTQQKAKGDVQEQLRKDFTFRLQDLSNNPSDANVTANAEDIAADANYPPAFKTTAARKFAELLAMPVEDRAKILSMSGMSGAERATARRPIASSGTVFDLSGNVIGQAPEPGFTLSPGQVRYPRGYTGVATAPEAVAAAVKPPDKVTIMTLLGYPLTPAGNEAYEAAIRAKPTVSAPTGTLAEMRATGIPETPEGLELYYRLKEKPPVVAPEPKTQEERNARSIALKAGPEGSEAFNAVFYAEMSRMTAKPAPVAARDDSSPDIKNMRALGIPETTAGFALYNELKSKTPVAAAPAPTEAMKNADAFARPYGEPGTPAYNKVFLARMEKLTAKSSGGEGGGGGAAKAPSGFRFTPTGDLEPIPGGPSAPGLTPKEIQKREALLPKARQAVSTVKNTMSVINTTIDRLLANSEGLNGITGLIYGNTPAITDAARQANADLKQLANLAFVQGLTELRATSATGAGVGNVSNREGDRFENLKASLDRTQSFPDLQASLRRLKTQADVTSQTLQEAFDETYQYKSNTPQSTNAPAAPASNITQQRQDANAAIAKGAPAAAVRQRFKQNTGQEL